MLLPCLGILLLLLTLPALAQEEAPTRFRVEIEITGVKGEPLRNVQAFLSLYRERRHPFLSPAMAQRLYAKAEGEIRAALQPFGHYRPRIRAQLDRSDPQRWRARFHIDPGPLLPVARLEIRIEGEGADDPDLTAQLRHLPLKEGDPFDHRRYEALKQQLLEAALEVGYPDARWQTRRAVVDLASYQARIHLVLHSGPRYRLGPLQLEQDILDDDFLRAYLPYRPGTPYRPAALLQLQRALNDSGYFARAEVRPLIRSAQGRAIPVEARLTPLPPDHYGLGLGYGTDTGARTRLNWERRYLNRRGHRLKAELYLAQVGDHQRLAYQIPLAYRDASQFTLDASRQSERIANRLRETHRLRAAYSQGREGWQRSYALDYQFELYRTDSALERGFLLMPNLVFTHRRADDRSHPRRGHRLDLELRGALQALLSSTDFLQTSAALRWIHPAGRDHRWLLRLKAGHTVIRDLARLPVSLRYFTGGDRTLRGYGYQTVGPLGGGGGTTLLETSVEYEHHLRRRWSAALFLDAANSSNDGPFPLQRGVGLGLRWRSPVGPVRLDLAWALDRRGTPWRIHFNIGPDL